MGKMESSRRSKKQTSKNLLVSSRLIFRNVFSLCASEQVYNTDPRARVLFRIGRGQRKQLFDFRDGIFFESKWCKVDRLVDEKVDRRGDVGVVVGDGGQ